METEKKNIPDGLWAKCPSCHEILYQPELEKTLSVCRHCGHHFRVAPQVYLDLLLDDGTANELDGDLKSQNPLGFKEGRNYSDQLKKAEKKTGAREAVRSFQGQLDSIPIALGIMDFGFIGGSMGSVVGEKVARLTAYATENHCPLILVCASGGARMQEGALSLMQMAKTSAYLAKYSEEGGLYIPILTDPTSGGVTASFGMLGDIILAEPGAFIGFAGPRVIKQTIGQDLPPGFQRSEFLLDKGFVDHIVTRQELKPVLAGIIRHLHAQR
ncbi:MAG: acetyl-CoA carboxylase, carboxyltransferase subunit beta [Fidelibacterota bacterium]